MAFHRRVVVKIVELFSMLLALFLVITLSGCTARVTHLAVASTKPIGMLAKEPGESTEGEACTQVFLLFPTGAPPGQQIQTAVFNAFEGKRGNLLVDGEITYTSWAALVFAQGCYKVRGKLVTADFGNK